MKNSTLKFSEHLQNISRSKIFGKFVLIVNYFIHIVGVKGCGQVTLFHMQDATFIAFGGREPICCIIKPIKERLPALLLGMQSSKEENK